MTLQKFSEEDIANIKQFSLKHNLTAQGVEDYITEYSFEKNYYEQLNYKIEKTIDIIKKHSVCSNFETYKNAGGAIILRLRINSFNDKIFFLLKTINLSWFHLEINPYNERILSVILTEDLQHKQNLKEIILT